MESLKLGFLFARDLHVQLINLSTGIIALTVTFMRDIIKNMPRRHRKGYLWAWILHVLSMLFGLWAIMALTGNLLDGDLALDPKSLEILNARIPGAIQIVLFFAGTSLVVWFTYLGFEQEGTALPSTLPKR